MISRVTRIEETLLLGFEPVWGFSVACRMSWAANRVTRRLEDIAYSLLGIFDVNMPLLYGEGDRAFLRLQEEIIKRSNDHSIFAWEDGSVERRMFFAPRPHSFVKSGNVVRWHGIKGGEPFAMTNHGLSLRLPLIVTKGTHGELRRRAILNCRYKDDLSGSIGFNIEQMTRSEGYALLHKGPKLTFISMDEIAAASKKYVSILEENDNTASLKGVPGQRNRTCWLKFLDSNDGFRIIEAYPQRFWNMRTGVFIPPRYPRWVIKGAARIRSTYGQELIVAFGYTRKGAPPDSDDAFCYECEWVSTVMVVKGKSLEQVCMESGICDKNLSGTAVEKQPRVPEVPGFRASIKCELVMDELVFVVSVDHHKVSQGMRTVLGFAKPTKYLLK